MWHYRKKCLESFGCGSLKENSARLPRHTWEYNIKKCSDKYVVAFELALYGSGYGYVVESCEDCNKLTDSVEGGDFFD